VGREAGRQDLVPHVWGRAEAHQQVWIKPGDGGAREREREKRVREGNLKALWSKGQARCMTK
jgi:hypothetical protein